MFYRDTGGYEVVSDAIEVQGEDYCLDRPTILYFVRVVRGGYLDELKEKKNEANRIRLRAINDSARDLNDREQKRVDHLGIKQMFLREKIGFTEVLMDYAGGGVMPFTSVNFDGKQEFYRGEVYVRAPKEGDKKDLPVLGFRLHGEESSIRFEMNDVDDCNVFTSPVNGRGMAWVELPDRFLVLGGNGGASEEELEMAILQRG